MTVLSLRTVPDPILRKKTRRIREFDSSIDSLIEDMIETMHAENGVGLAANQVGIPLKLCVIGIPEEDEIRVLINPEIIVRKGERELEEGCLSIPGYRGKVNRSIEVRVRAQDRFGKVIRIKAENNLLAQALEHEIDHLNGSLYVDRLVSGESIWKLEEPTSDESDETESGGATKDSVR
ncbi:peptide deformylase [SAR202 cluster bacterium AD-802-E10_MRT_200m]|nr:peptide deformylase [SAR202 cluster bacterium AD-802-E10_MRT_200m]